MLRYDRRTKPGLFGLVRHLARKWRGSILTTCSPHGAFSFKLQLTSPPSCLASVKSRTFCFDFLVTHTVLEQWPLTLQLQCTTAYKIQPSTRNSVSHRVTGKPQTLNKFVKLTTLCCSDGEHLRKLTNVYRDKRNVKKQVKECMLSDGQLFISFGLSIFMH